MASISAYDSNSISTLFSSLSTSSSSSSTSGATDLLGISYSDYNCVKSGSYYKLMKAYYSKVDSGDSSTSTSADSTKTLTAIESSADELNESASALYKSSSLYNKKQVTGEDGTVSYEYDMDSIYDKVSAFIDDYNSMIESAGQSETSSIASSAANLVNYTNANSSMLSSVGISIDSKDYTLSIDETKFKSADMSNITSLFKGTGSYAYGVAVKGSMINSYAESEASKSNTYTSSGSYSSAYSAGSVLDALT